MAVTASVAASISANQTAALALGTAEAKISRSVGVSFASGTGAGQVDKVWSAQRTLAASATEDLDLAGTALDDPYGADTVFVKVKALYIKAADGNTNNVVVGAGTNPWATLLNTAGTITLRPGEFILVGCGSADTNGHAVTAATGDILKVTNSAGTTGVTYDIIIVGTSA